MAEIQLQNIGENYLDSIEHTTHQMVNWLNRLSQSTGINPPQFVHGGLLYWMGYTTTETDTYSSIPLRQARQEAFHAIQDSNDITEKQSIIQKEHERKRLTDELYAHHLIEVDTSYGTLGGQVSILNPNAEGPVTIIIPGSSNDPESAESGAVSIALLTGFKTIILGYPDAPNGKIKKEFIQAVIRDSYRAQESFRKDRNHGIPPTYEAYVEFFDKLIHSDAITSKLPKDGTFDLWSQSAGGAISAKLLTREEYQKRVQNAVIANPAASSTFSISSIELFLSGFKTAIAPFRPLHRFPRYTWWKDPRRPKQSEDKKMKLSSWEALLLGSHFLIPQWQYIHTAKSIIVYSGGKDEATRSYDTFNSTSNGNNDSIQVLFDPNAHHNTILTHPDETIEKILSFQADILQNTRDNNS